MRYYRYLVIKISILAISGGVFNAILYCSRDHLKNKTTVVFAEFVFMKPYSFSYSHLIVDLHGIQLFDLLVFASYYNPAFARTLVMTPQCE